MRFDLALKALRRGEIIIRRDITHSHIKIVKEKLMRLKSNGVITEARLSGKDLLSDDWCVLKLS